MSASVLRTGQASEAFGGQSRSTCLGFANPAESSATSPTNVLKRFGPVVLRHFRPLQAV